MDIEELLKHRPFVRALARRLVRDQSRADDLEQQTWLTAIEKPPVHRGALRAWLHAVVRNLARTQNRAEFRRTKHEAGRGASGASNEGLPTPQEALVKAEWHRRLIEAVMELDEPYRTTVLLRYFEDLDSKQIATMQNVPSATVRTRLRRGLAKVRVALAEQSQGEDKGGSHAAWIAGLMLLARPPIHAPVAPTHSSPEGSVARTFGRWGTALGTLAVVALVAVVLRDRGTNTDSSSSRAAVAPVAEHSARRAAGATRFVSIPAPASGHRFDVVVLVDGAPAQGASVVVSNTRAHAWKETPVGRWERLRGGVTDPDGLVRFAGLPNGYVRIAAWKPGSARTVAYVYLPLSFATPQVIELRAERVFEIRVVDRYAMAPIAGAWAGIVEGDREPAPASFLANSDGLLRLSGFARNDSASVEIATNGFAKEQTNLRIGTVAIEPLTRTARWRVDGVPPAADRAISIHRPFDSNVEDLVTVANGELILTGLPEGLWPEHWATAPDGRVARLEVESDSTRFEQPTSLDVRLTDESGAAVADVAVHLEEVATGVERVVRRTDAEGRARFSVARGAERLRLAMRERGHARWKVLRNVDASQFDIRIPVARRLRLEGRLPNLFALVVDGERCRPTVAPGGGTELILRPEPGQDEARVDLLARGYCAATRIVRFADGDQSWQVELVPASTLRFRPFGRPGDLVLADPLTGAVRRRGPWRFRLEAGPDGVVRDSMIPEGRHMVLDLLRNVWSAPFDAPRGGADLTIDFDLSQPGVPRLFGVVVAHGGIDLARTVVEILPGGVTEVGADGSFRFPDPMVQPFVIRARHASVEGEISMIVERTDQPIRLALSSYATARFTITGPTKPAIRTRPRVRAGSVTVEAVRTGNELVFGKLPVGRTDLWVDVPGAAPVLVPSVDLRDGENALGVLKLSPGGSLRLRFRDAPGASAPSVVVSLQSLSHPTYRRSSQDAEPVTGLGAGTFRLTVWDRYTGLQLFSGLVTSDGRSETVLELDR